MIRLEAVNGALLVGVELETVIGVLVGVGKLDIGISSSLVILDKGLRISLVSESPRRFLTETCSSILLIVSLESISLLVNLETALNVGLVVDLGLSTLVDAGQERTSSTSSVAAGLETVSRCELAVASLELASGINLVSIGLVTVGTTELARLGEPVSILLAVDL